MLIARRSGPPGPVAVVPTPSRLLLRIRVAAAAAYPAMAAALVTSEAFLTLSDAEVMR